MNWQDIPKFPQIHYRVVQPWYMLPELLERWKTEHGLDLNPDFQRGHVWTEKQQIAYVEYALMEPQSGLDIYFNHPNWMGSFKGNLVLVDGKQRLEAARRFLLNEIPAFGLLRKEFGDKYSEDRTSKDWMPLDAQFHFNIMKMKTKTEILKWYIDFNAGGTPHSKDEIGKVKELLKKENL